MKKLFLLIFSIPPAHFLFGQNLVTNSSFEEFYQCPTSYNASTEGKIAPGWTSPTKGTPDLFNACNKGVVGVPNNWAGQSKANTGHGYAGIYVYTFDPTHSYREYLQTELRYPLKKGGEYEIEFFYKLSSNSRYSVDRIGILVSDSSFKSTGDEIIHTPTYEQKSAKTYDKRITGGWEKFFYRYQAKGGERYLTIGNFSTNDQTKSFYISTTKAKEPLLNKQAYFYIDDVRLTPLKEPVQPEIPVTFNLYENYILKNLQFDFDKYHLVEASFPELQKVIAAMKKHTNWQITVRGHTDFMGSDAFNMELSKKRAASVANYLIEQGIQASRITSEGRGKTQPLNNGNSDQARAINRRVEIMFYVK
jgi:outer membrane protein OmpA-like peptidoglycan-associated protein